MGAKAKTRWQNNLSSAEECLKYMYQHNIHCDVTIQVTDDRDRSSMCFNAHKLVLATRSSVFADMFFNCTRSRNLLSVKRSPRAFDIFLWYIYSNTVEAGAINELIESFELATCYKVFSFGEICAKKLYEKSSDINKSNVCTVMKIANLTKSNPLQEICFGIIQKELGNVFLSDDFLTLDKKSVWDLLKDSKSRFCPKQMLKTIIRWMIQQNVSDRKFLSLINFSGFKTDDFLKIIEEFPHFFTGYEICAIVSKLTLADSSDFPTWCNFSNSQTNEKCLPLHSLYERMELIKGYATKVQTDCNRRFNKITMHSSDCFEQEMFLNIIMKCHTLKLIMMELAFGSEFVPLDCLMIELYNNVNREKKMKTVKFHLIPSLHHYYLLLDDNAISSLSSNFKLLLVVKAFGLLEWGSNGPVSNQKYRVASVSDFSEIKVADSAMIQVARLKPFLDWLLFINPKNGEKTFIVSTLFFDTTGNIEKTFKAFEN